MSWDDGKHAKVKSVQLTFDDVIRSIQVEYHGTNLQSQRRGNTVGAKSDGFTLSPDEYITEVSGYYKTTFSGDVITMLTFKTNKKTYGPYGNKTHSSFSAFAPIGSQIAGFSGTSGNALNSIDVHFAPIPPAGSIKPDDPGTKPGGGGSKPDGPETKPGDGGSKPDGPGTKPGDGDSKPGNGDSKPDGYEKMGPVGGNKGNTFDDGTFDGAKKVTVAADEYSITYIKIDYVKDGRVETREHGTIRGELKEFTVDYPNDNIKAVGGTYDHIFNYDTTLITSLYFTTSKGFTSPKFGETKGTEFKLEGAKLVGFHGRGGHAIDALGAHFTPLIKKLGPVGGNKGNTFDDGVFEGVKKVTVGADEFSITYIKVEYEKNGKVEAREHGTVRGELKEFSVDYPKDSIVAVGGTYDHIFNYDTTLVTSLYFTTSKGFTSPKFGETKGTEFKLEGGKLVGFHGRGGHAIDALGAHFTSLPAPVTPPTPTEPPTSKPEGTGKMGPVGGNKGNTFDDGTFDGVKKVTVSADEFSITYIKIDYVKDRSVETREHGTIRGELKEFTVDYPNDSIVAVGGSYDHIFNYDTTLITSLYFTTSKGFTSPKFGETKGTDFKLEDKNGGKLVGFHGRGGYAIDAIGAHFGTSSGGSSSTGSSDGVEKLEAQGGKGGNQWDDGGEHDGVAKIYVAAGGLGVENIQFDYVKNGETKKGPFRGEKARAPIVPFEISHPDEHLISVEGWFDSTNVIQGIQFKTNKKSSEVFGYEFSGDGTQFSLQVKDKKIVGFHGFADSHINSLGAYFAPITVTPLKPAKKLQAVGGNEGAIWDDGVFDGVKKILVGQGEDGVSFLKIEYNKGSQTIIGDGHGKKTLLDPEPFELEYPSEYITGVGVYYDSLQGEKAGTTLVTSLKFKTNKRTSQPFGMTAGEYVELKEEGHKIVGFHGKAGDYVHQIGVYVAPITN